MVRRNLCVAVFLVAKVSVENAKSTICAENTLSGYGGYVERSCVEGRPC